MKKTLLVIAATLLIPLLLTIACAPSPTVTPLLAPTPTASYAGITFDKSTEIQGKLAKAKIEWRSSIKGASGHVTTLGQVSNLSKIDRQIIEFSIKAKDCGITIMPISTTIPAGEKTELTISSSTGSYPCKVTIKVDGTEQVIEFDATFN